MRNIDLYIQSYFVERTDFLTQFFFGITSVFNLSSLFVLLVALVSYLVFKWKGVTNLYLFLFSLFLTTLATYILKISFGIARPLDGFVSAYGQSFPSYHAAISTTFFFILNYIFYDKLNKFWRFFSSALVLLVAFSRIYLGVHWFSDVVFGCLLGVSVSWVSIYIFRAKRAIV